MELVGSWLDLVWIIAGLGLARSIHQNRCATACFCQRKVFLKTVSSSGSNMGLNSIRVNSLCIYIYLFRFRTCMFGRDSLPCLISHFIYIYTYSYMIYIPFLCLHFIDRSQEASKRRAVRCWFGDKKNHGSSMAVLAEKIASMFHSWLELQDTDTYWKSQTAFAAHVDISWKRWLLIKLLLSMFHINTEAFQHSHAKTSDKSFFGQANAAPKLITEHQMAKRTDQHCSFISHADCYVQIKTWKTGDF